MAEQARRTCWAWWDCGHELRPLVEAAHVPNVQETLNVQIGGRAQAQRASDMPRPGGGPHTAGGEQQVVCGVAKAVGGSRG